MVVQMSLLCSVHEHQPFAANAMVEAIEPIVRDFKGSQGALQYADQGTFTMKSSVSLIVPLSQDEPHFTLSSSERDPKFGPELRAKILGSG